jgi:hypothetical protein
MNHLEVWELEQETPHDRKWMKWIAECERLYGRDIDGDEGDKVCLDGAYRAFREGMNPASYLRSAWQYLKD